MSSPGRRALAAALILAVAAGSGAAFVAAAGAHSARPGPRRCRLFRVVERRTAPRKPRPSRGRVTARAVRPLVAPDRSIRPLVAPDRHARLVVPDRHARLVVPIRRTRLVVPVRRSRSTAAGHRIRPAVADRNPRRVRALARVIALRAVRRAGHLVVRARHAGLARVTSIIAAALPGRRVVVARIIRPRC